MTTVAESSGIDRVRRPRAGSASRRHRARPAVDFLQRSIRMGPNYLQGPHGSRATRHTLRALPRRLRLRASTRPRRNPGRRAPSPGLRTTIAHRWEAGRNSGQGLHGQPGMVRRVVRCTLRRRLIVTLVVCVGSEPCCGNSAGTVLRLRK